MSWRLSGPLLIGASTTIAEFLLPRVLGEFKALHPEVQPKLTVGNSETIENRVAEHTLDLGLIEAPSHLPALQTEVCSATRFSIVSELPTVSLGCTSGWSALNSPRTRGSRNSAIVVLAPIRSGPDSRQDIYRSRVSSSADSARILSAYSSTTSPAGVNAILPWPRSNSRALKCSSSCLIWNVTAGWVMNRVSAALVKLICFATAWNTCSLRSAMAPKRPCAIL